MTALIGWMIYMRGSSESDGDGARTTSHVENETCEGKEVEEAEHGRAHRVDHGHKRTGRGNASAEHSSWENGNKNPSSLTPQTTGAQHRKYV